jgi:dTDP-4-amino-4,6-dideoxygalactose transaminase
MIPPVAVPFSAGELLKKMLAGRRSAGTTFASTLAAATGARAATFFPSGRAALSDALRGAASPGRDEVLVPAYTCWTVAASVVRAGLRVRMVDIDPVALDLDPEGLAAAPTARLATVIAAHLFARTSDVAAIAKTIAERDPQVRVIEDAAQAWPASSGPVTWPVVLSFGRGKPLPLGGGGALLDFSGDRSSERDSEPQTGGWDEALAFLAAAAFGRPATFGILERMPGLGIGTTVYDPSFETAAPHLAWRDRLGVGLMGSLTGLAAERTGNAAVLAERAAGLRGWRLTAAAKAEGPLRLPLLAPSHDARDSALARLRRAGVAASPMYPGTIAEIPALRPHLANPEATIPGAAMLAACLITLPVYPGMTLAQRTRIADALASLQ